MDDDEDPLYSIAGFRRTIQTELYSNSVWVMTATLALKGFIYDFIKKNRITIRAVIADEACQTSEVHLLMPLVYGCHTLIQVGDPRQLRPYAKGDNRTMTLSNMERLIDSGAGYCMLDVQYRMYKGKLH